MGRDVLQAFSQIVYEKRHLASLSPSIRSDVCTSAYMKQRNFHLKDFQKIPYFGLLSNILDTYSD
jgi:hypothetical protein